jgi:hypothetical protein
MRSLKQYITESVHPYKYTIKIAGEVDKNFIDMFKYNLKKFDPIEMSEPVSTPVQKSPYGFPNISNEPVTIIKAQFRYPATEPMIQQIAQLLGYNINMVRAINTDYDESVDEEYQQYENQMQNSPVLTQEEMGSADGAEEANKAYGNSYLDSIKDQTKEKKLAMPFDGKKTPDAFDPFKPETYMSTMGKESPMTKITRPAKPQTGASK